MNERTGISVEMAIRLSKAFGSSPGARLGMQMAYDLWQPRAHGGDPDPQVPGGLIRDS